jgi:hypothetical protein
MIGEWSIGVLEYWDKIGKRVLKVRILLPTPSSMELLWRPSATMVFNPPILHYSITPWL